MRYMHGDLRFLYKTENIYDIRWLLNYDASS